MGICLYIMSGICFYLLLLNRYTTTAIVKPNTRGRPFAFLYDIAPGQMGRNN